jgi:hypothetical protein
VDRLGGQLDGVAGPGGLRQLKIQAQPGQQGLDLGASLAAIATTGSWIEDYKVAN